MSAVYLYRNTIWPSEYFTSLTLPLLRLLTRSSQSSATSRPEVLPSFGQPDPNSLSSVAFLVWGSHVTRELSWSRWIQRKISGRLAPWPMRCWTLPSTTSSVWFPSFIEIWIGKKELKEYAKAMALVDTNCSTSMHWYSNYTIFAIWYWRIYSLICLYCWSLQFPKVSKWGTTLEKNNKKTLFNGPILKIFIFLSQGIVTIIRQSTLTMFLKNIGHWHKD